MIRYLRSNLVFSKTRYNHVCDLRLICLIMMCFGYYTDFNFRPFAKYSLKIYCYVLTLVSLCIYLVVEIPILGTLIAVNVIVYLVFYMVSLHTKQIYLLEFYNSDKLIDELPDARRCFNKLKNIYMLLILISVLFHILIMCIILSEHLYRLNSFRTVLSIFLEAFAHIYLDLGRITIILLYSLLYCRVKLFRSEVSKHSKRSMKRNIPRHQYLLMYKSICDKFDGIKYPIALMITVSIAGFFVYLVLASMLWLPKFVRQLHTYTIFTIFSILRVIYDFSLIYCPGIIQHLITSEIEQTKKYINNQLVAITVERNREELQLLIQYLRARPLCCVIARVVPVNAALPLASLLFVLNYVVILLQFFKPFSGDNIAKC